METSIVFWDERGGCAELIMNSSVFLIAKSCIDDTFDDGSSKQRTVSNRQ